MEINISGGIITRRALLNTTQYNLSILLHRMGYTNKDVYKSSLYFKQLSNSLDGNYNVEFDRRLLTSFVTKGLNKDIDFTNKSISSLEFEISNLKHEIMNLESDLVKAIGNQKKFSESKGSNSRKIQNIHKNIEVCRKKIDINQNKLSLLESELKSLKSNLDLISKGNSPIKDLRDLYLKKYFVSNVKEGKFNFNQ